MQKGFYPYGYMSNFEKFTEQLLRKEMFYSSLTGKKNSDKEYEHVFKVSNKSEMKTMKDYHIFVFKCDVLLLDVLEKIKNNSLKNYGLCQSHYLSAPALSWDAMLNMTKLELINLFQVLTCTYFLKSYQRLSFFYF